MLDALLEAAFEATGFKFGRPVQRQDDYDDEVGGDDDAELGDDIDDDMAVEEEEGLYMDGINSPGGDEDKEYVRQEVLESAIDPKVWMMELERVAPLLKSSSDQVLTPNLMRQ